MKPTTGAETNHLFVDGSLIATATVDFTARAQTEALPGLQLDGRTGAACSGGTLATVATLNSACSTGHTAPFNVAAFPVTSDISQRLTWFGTVRGRIGATVTPTVLLYATAAWPMARSRRTTRSPAQHYGRAGNQ